MATVYSAQQTTARGSSGTTGALRTQDSGGRMRVQTFSWSPAAAAASTDQVVLCTLPVGARVISGRLVANATLQSAAGVAMIGVSGNLNKYMVSTSDFSSATASKTFADTVAQNYLSNGFGASTAAQLTAGETILLTFQTSGATAGGQIVYGHIEYVVD